MRYINGIYSPIIRQTVLTVDLSVSIKFDKTVCYAKVKSMSFFDVEFTE